jgi:hypothetical protein
MVVCGVLFGLYNFWILNKVKKRHDREMGLDREDGREERLVEKIGRKVNEPGTYRNSKSLRRSNC